MFNLIGYQIPGSYCVFYTKGTREIFPRGQVKEPKHHLSFMYVAKKKTRLPVFWLIFYCKTWNGISMLFQPKKTVKEFQEHVETKRFKIKVEGRGGENASSH